MKRATVCIVACSYLYREPSYLYREPMHTTMTMHMHIHTHVQPAHYYFTDAYMW